MSKPLEEVKKLTIGQLAALVHAIGGLVVVKAILCDKNLAKRVAEFISNAMKETNEAIEEGAKKAASAFTAFVDYKTPTYAELKKSFDWVNDWYEHAKFELIDACKGVSQTAGNVAFEVVQFDFGISTADALVELDKRGLRPATDEELVAFAKAFPDEQRKYPIVALGSVCLDRDGYRNVAYLVEYSVGRGLDLDWVEYGWRGAYGRFLAVSK